MTTAGTKKASNGAAAASAGVPHVPNPRRVAAGKLNRLKSKGLTPEGRERLRQAALLHRPWRFTTGPRTPEGKARVAAAARARRKAPLSLRELRAELTDLRALATEMREARQLAGDARSE
jgi:hypothetical protein